MRMAHAGEKRALTIVDYIDSSGESPASAYIYTYLIVYRYTLHT